MEPRDKIAPLIFLILLAAHIIAIWTLPYFPTQDGPSHIYNLVILRDLLNGGNQWGNIFSYQLQMQPNLAFNLICYPLLGFFSPLVVEKIFLSCHVILMAFSVIFFMSVFARSVFPFAFFVYPLLLTHSLLMGFYSYVITVPAFIIAMSGAVLLDRRQGIFKFFYYNIIGALLFYLHLIPFVFFILSVFFLTIDNYNGLKSTIKKFVHFIIITAPLLILFTSYKLSSPAIISHNLSNFPTGKRLIFLLTDLALFSTVNYNPLQLMISGLISLLIFSSLILALYNRYHGSTQRAPESDNHYKARRLLLKLTVILILIYFVVPRSFGEGDFFNDRIPWLIFLLLLPLLDKPGSVPARLHTLLIVVSVTLFFFANVRVLHAQSMAVVKYVSGTSYGFQKSALIMPYINHGRARPRVDPLMHAASYYGIALGLVNTGNYETASRLFPVHFRRELLPLPDPNYVSEHPATIRLESYPSITYIIGWNLSPMDQLHVGNTYAKVWQNEQLSIWQRKQNR